MEDGMAIDVGQMDDQTIIEVCRGVCNELRDALKAEQEIKNRLGYRPAVLYSDDMTTVSGTFYGPNNRVVNF